MSLDETDSSKKSIDRSTDSTSDSTSVSQILWDDMRSQAVSVVNKLDSGTAGDPDQDFLDLSLASVYGPTEVMGDSTNAAAVLGITPDGGAAKQIPEASTPAVSTDGGSLWDRALSAVTDLGRSITPEMVLDDLSRPLGDAGAVKPAGDAGKPPGDSSKVPPADTPPKTDGQEIAPIQRAGRVSEAEISKIRDNPEVKKEHEALEKAIKDLPQDQQERIRFRMQQFEIRSVGVEPHLSPKEVADTYKEIRKLIEAPDSPGQALNRADRITVAEQVLRHAAQPDTIDQGKHETCSAATVETRMYARNPSAAAQMVADVALKGEYTTRGKPPLTVHVNPESLKPGTEESQNPPVDGQRDRASQVFHVAAVNMNHERHGLKVPQKDGSVKEYPPGSVEYRQGPPRPDAKPPNDSGEVLVDKKTGEPIKDAEGDPIQYPALEDGHLTDTYNDITGADPPEAALVIANDGYVYGDGKNVTKIQTYQDLQRAVEQAAEPPPGKFPIILKVNTGKEPFFSATDESKAGGLGGPHFITISGYDKDTGEVKVDNQWGSGADYQNMKLGDIHRAMMPTDQAIKLLHEECALNAKEGKVDYVKELELLRLKHSAGMNEDAYERQLAWLTKQVAKDAQDNRGGHVDRQAIREITYMMKQMEEKDPERYKRVKEQVSENVIENIKKDGFISQLPADYASGDMQAEADKIFAAKGEHWYNDDDELAVYKALANKSPAEIAQMEKLFQDKYKMTIEQYLETFMNESEMEKARTHLARSRAQYCPA